MATGSTAQMGSAQEAGRPQPQTTVEASGGPFIRHSQPGMAPIYNVTGSALGGILTQPLVARPGYFRAFRVTHSLTTGGALAAAVITPDAPFNVNALIQLKDAFGTPLIVCDGWTTSQLINVLSGGFGTPGDQTNIAANLPSNAVLSATTGAGQFSYALPLEFAKAYGVLSAANASLLPTLQFNFNGLTTIFGAATTGTPPTVGTALDTSFYWLPEGVAVEPPGLGTTRQWILQQANPLVPASGSARIQFPRLGGYLDTIAVILRNNAGANARDGGYYPGGPAAAVAASTSRLQLYVDGVPMIDATMAEWYDDMAIQFGLTPVQLGFGSTVAGTFPAPVTPTFANQNLGGVVAVSRKTSMSATNLGLLDTGEAYLSTNPGTLLEMNFAPAGAGTAGTAATASVLVGQIVPTGAVIQGLPEV